MKVTMIGMGAVGAVTGKRLLNLLGSENFCCIVDAQRKQRYLENGIYINGQKIDFNFVEPDDASETDLVIIATKNHALKQVISQIQNCVGPDTMILSLLNGIQSERELEQAFGKDKVLYGYIVNLSSINVNGQITCGHEGVIYFGEDSNEKTQRVLSVKALFDQAGIDCVIPDDIHLCQWKKFLLNVSCNTISALCRKTYKGFRTQEVKELVRDCSYEVIAVANKMGIALTAQMIEENLETTGSLNDDGKTSMFQDVEAERITENEYFCGTVVRLGKELGIATPVCELLYRLVACLESGK